MENASKALIIAGAILLSILIIGLGMLIFNQAKEAIDGTGIDKVKVQTYNAQFMDYTGTNVNGTKVRSLYDTVRNHNVTTQEDESLKVSINGANTTSALNAARAAIKTGKTYKVEVGDDGYDTATGYIINITVTENGTSGNGGNGGNQ